MYRLDKLQQTQTIIVKDPLLDIKKQYKMIYNL